MKMLVNEEAGPVYKVTEVSKVFGGMIGDPFYGGAQPLHILEITVFWDSVGREIVRRLYLYGVPRNCKIKESEYLNYKGRDFDETEKTKFSLSTVDALEAYINKYNKKLKNLSEEGLEELSDDGFHNFNFDDIIYRN